VFVASGDDRHRGVELTFFGVVADGVRLLGGYTFLDAEQQATGLAATNGKRVIGTPKQYGNAGVEWDIPGVDGLMVEGRVVYTGSSYADAVNTLLVPGWTRFDIGARYEMKAGSYPLTLRARIDNVADKDYWASVGGYPGQGYLVVGAPRTFNLSASIAF
jgi:iron complex outermembrane receptor protein